METPPGIISRIFEFGWALLPYWWLLAPGGIFAIEPMIEGLAPSSWKSAIDRWWPKRARHRHFRWASVIALMIASFLAFDDVNMRKLELQHRLTAVSQQAGRSAPVTKGLEFTLSDRVTVDIDSHGSEIRRRIVILTLSNKLTRELVGLSVIMTKADGPGTLENIPVPHKLDIPDHLNPLSYSELGIASYREQPANDRYCLLLAPYPLDNCGLWSSKTVVEYTFFSSASDSLPATITVRVWVENNKLNYRVLS